MADATEQVLVSINGDASGISKAVSESKQAVKSLGEETDKAGEKAKASGGKFKAGLAAAAIGATAALPGIVNFSKQSIKAYNSVQDSVQKFQTVAGNAKWSQSMQSEAVKSFGVISGGASRAAATTAASMGLTGKSFETLKGPMGDLAVKFGGVAGASDQFAGISQNMARAIQTGAVRSLARYGVVLSDSQKKAFAAADQQKRSQMVADALSKSVGGLNDKLSQTPAGQMQALSNSVAAVKTNFGGLLQGAVSPDAFVDSLNKMISNALGLFTSMAPKLMTGITATFSAIAKAAPTIVKTLTGAIQGALPQLLGMIPDFVKTIAGFIPPAAQAIANAAPQLVDAAAGVIPSILAALSNAVPSLVSAVAAAIPDIINGLLKALPLLINAAIQLVMGLVYALPQIIQALVKALPTIINLLISATLAALPQLINGFITLVSALVIAMPTIIMALVKDIPNIIRTIASGVVKSAPILISGVRNVATRAWNAMKDVWSAFGPWVMGVWNGAKTVFSNALGWVRGFFASGWGQAILFLVNPMVGLVNLIVQHWNTIRNAFGTAWHWIENTVINPFKAGLGRLGNAFNGMKDMASRAFDSLKDAAATPVRWIVNVVYTNGIQRTWNGIAGAIGLNNLKLPDAHFASGGIMPGYTPGRDTMLAQVSGGEAIMRPEFTRALGANNINALNAAARSGGVQGVRGLLGFANGGIVGAVTSFVGHAVSTVADIISDPGAAVRKLIVNPIRSMLSGIGSGSFGVMLAQMPIRVAEGLIDKVKSFVGAGGASDYKAGAGVAQWTPQVLQALQMLGQPASWLNTVLRRMNQESGGNPHAINNWDSNAKAGIPSQGLMQTIPPTFAAYAGPLAGRGILDPLANIYAGLNYAIHRYGSLSALNRPGGYARGGKHPDNELAWFNGDEYTLNADSARSLGYKSLDYMNRTGKLPQKTGGSTINVTSQSTDPLAVAQQLDRMLRTA